MKQRCFFLLLVAGFVFLFIGPANFAPHYTPSTIPTEKNVLSDEPIIGSRTLLERGTSVYLGGGSYSYSTVLGEFNTFNGSHYVPYLYDDATHNATFAGHSIVLYDWYATFSDRTQTLVDDMRWVVQYWQTQAGGRWRELDLYDHSFLPAQKEHEQLTFGQHYTDYFSSLDVWYTIHNYDQIKITLNFTTDTTRIYRFVWMFSGVDGELIEGEKGLMFDDVNIGWGDAEINATYEWTVATKKLDISFDNVTIYADETYILDPSVNPVMGSDSDDDWWYLNSTHTVYHYTTSANQVILNHTNDNAFYYAQQRFALSIPKDATIDSANFTAYEDYDVLALDTEIRRIDEDNVGSLEGDSSKPIPSNDTVMTYSWDASDEEYGPATSVTALVQEQVNLAGWVSGYYIGFQHMKNPASSVQWKWYDYQHADTNHAYMNITYTEGPTNNDPVNDQTPTLDNADDTDNMYAQYREYKMTVYVSDADGYADIDYLEVGLWSNDQATEYFRFRYDEDTDTFSEEYDIGTVVSLNTGSSMATESGNDIDAQFWFTIDWDHADLTDIDTKCYVTDDEPATDTDWYEANFDVETRLDYSVAPSVTGDDAGTVDRGDFDESFTIGGTLIYYGSGDDNPASDQIDVWISASEYGTNVGPWSDTTLTAGAFVVTCYADNALGQDTYTIKPVLEGAGSGGATQYYTTDVIDTYIADIAQVQSYTVSDSRVNINDNVNVDVTIYYDYDNSAITDGTVTINGESASHQGSGVWRITVSESTVTSNTYDTVAVTGNTHGITTEDQNGQSTTVIWDRLVVTLSADDYSVINGTQVNITISIVYDYDDTPFTYYNLSMTRDAVFWYVFNHVNSSLCNDTAADVEYTYTVNQLNNETTYGITAFTSNSIDIEWSAFPPITTTTPTITTVGILYQLFLSLNMWGYLGPIALVIGGYIVSQKDGNLGILWFIVECLVVAQYFLLVSATPDYWWHIFIILLGGLFTCVYPLWGKR